MTEEITIKAGEVIIQTYPIREGGGMWIARPETGVSVYHKPSEVEVKWDKYRSQHKNKDFCIKVLRDMLQPFKKGDIIVTECGLAEVYAVKDQSVLYKGDNFMDSQLIKDNLLGHSEEGYAYKMTKFAEGKLEELQKHFEEDCNYYRNMIEGLSYD